MVVAPSCVVYLLRHSRIARGPSPGAGCPGGESGDHVAARARSFLEDLLQRDEQLQEEPDQRTLRYFC